MTNSRLQVKMTPEELNLLRQGAQALGTNVSEFSRMMLLAAAKGAISGDEETLDRLIRSTGRLLASKMKYEQDTSG